MRRSLAVAFLLASGCASSTLQPCANLSGIWRNSGEQSRTGTIGKAVLPDGVPLSSVTTLQVEQEGCKITLRATLQDGTRRNYELKELEWTEEGGASVTYNIKRGSNILPAAAGSTTRTFSLRAGGDPQSLIVADHLDERGLALLIMPYHNEGQVEFLMVRQ
jgi:hypothetical protein